MNSHTDCTYVNKSWYEEQLRRVDQMILGYSCIDRQISTLTFIKMNEISIHFDHPMFCKIDKPCTTPLAGIILYIYIFINIKLINFHQIWRKTKSIKVDIRASQCIAPHHHHAKEGALINGHLNGSKVVWLWQSLSLIIQWCFEKKDIFCI